MCVYGGISHTSLFCLPICVCKRVTFPDPNFHLNTSLNHEGCESGIWLSSHPLLFEQGVMTFISAGSKYEGSIHNKHMPAHAYIEVGGVKLTGLWIDRTHFRGLRSSKSTFRLSLWWDPKFHENFSEYPADVEIVALVAESFGVV